MWAMVRLSCHLVNAGWAFQTTHPLDPEQQNHCDDADDQFQIGEEEFHVN